MSDPYEQASLIASQEKGVADRVVIPLQNVGVLVLTREEFDAALSAGSDLMASGAPSTSAADGPEGLLDAEQAAIQLNVSSRWLEDSARAGLVPHYKLGRFIRFRVNEIARHCRIAVAPIG